MLFITRHLFGAVMLTFIPTRECCLADEQVLLADEMSVKVVDDGTPRLRVNHKYRLFKTPSCASTNIPPRLHSLAIERESRDRLLGQCVEFKSTAGPLL